MPSDRGSRWRFHGVELNVAGWTALVAPGVVVGAALGLAFVDGLRVVVATAAVGGVVAWLTGLAVEHRQYDRRPRALPVGDAGEALAMLEGAGIAAAAGTAPDGTGRMWPYVVVRSGDESRARSILPEWPAGTRSRRRLHRAEAAVARAFDR